MRKKEGEKNGNSVTENVETTISKIVGEPPVVIDSIRIDKTVGQMQLSLYNKGYFNNNVHDSVVYKDYVKYDGGKGRMYYTIAPGARYRIGKLEYQIEDPLIASKLKEDQELSLLKIGSMYDKNILDDERDRIVKKLKNQGYFFFSKDYIQFEADTALGEHSIAVKLQIEQFREKNTSGINERDHRRYKLRRIYIQPDFFPEEEERALDTVAYGEYQFLILPGSLNKKGDRNAYIRFKTIARKVFMKENEYFKMDDFNNTYHHLASLNIFKFINIEFERTQVENELSCLIQLNPIPRHTIQIEAEGTNAADNLGIAENLTYRNKNIFKGAEMLEISVKTALESQKAFTDDDNGIGDLGLFNTIETGPEVKVNFPRLLFPIKEERIPKRYDPKTSLHLSYNYQLRSDYTRWIWEGGVAYEWEESPQKTHILTPFNLSSVKIKDDSPILTSSFANDFIKNSFTNHFISATRYSFIYSDQQLNRKENFTYFRGNLEIAGNALHGLSSATNAEQDPMNGSYSIFGIQYAQYVRADLDVRRYNLINQYSTIVFRFTAGLGLPYGNSTVMPFEKSYFSGGANGLRAWQARNIGPGSYQGPTNYDQIGDIKLEGNIESRFEFLGPLEGAAFIDAGNIWLARVDEASDDIREGAKFEFNSFYKEIAIGAGLGIRLNYDYFLIRVDAAVPVKDPAEPVGQRWVLDDASFSRINFNLGIGYPF
jgi:outer membrane protein assembly factor BamA